MSNNNKKIGTVKIRTSCVKLLKENFERILVLFAAILEENSSNSLNCDNTNTLIIYDVYLSGNDEIVRTISEDLITRLQKYVDDICIEGCNTINNKSSTTTTTGEDSSYDSDCEGYDGGPSQISLGTHQDVSRTTSDTLAEEFAEYVQTTVVPENSPGYNARVEFALKLGYTEKHVQVALQKLGPAPTQNELLAELIKLSAQKGLGGGGGGGGASSSCDSSPTESLVSDLGLLDRFDLVETGPSSTSLRSIVIDGSNVAMSHGNKELFSCRGIKICIDWFQSRGHKDITVFVPKWRKEAPRVDNPIKDQEILAELEKERLLVFTPSRLVFGKRMVCYDDRYILKLAAHTDGVVVSNDNYRDLCQESVEFRKVVEERILMYSFVNDHFMPPDDPLGRAGPTLDNFLRRQPRKGENTGTPPPPPCPYGKKCTYGNKCKYNHPERGPLPHKSVTERLSEHAQRHLQARECKDGGGDIRKNPLGRTRSNIPPPKETQQHTTVSKSRSVDNVGVLSQQLVNQQHHQFSENFQFLPSSSQQDSSQKNYVYPSSSSSSSSQSSQTQAENLHRKLARQLTLNPTAGGDLRLINNNSRRFGPSSPGPAAGRGFLGNNWDVIHHQGVTRIASAPDSYRCSSSSSSQQQQNQNNAPISGWNGMQQQQSPPHPQHGIPPVRHMHRMSSCSDSQLNVWPGPAGQYYQWNSVTTQEDARRKLHYHLAAIFPEEQVIQAMQMYPDETNAQKICAAILAIFSNDKS